MKDRLRLCLLLLLALPALLAAGEPAEKAPSYLEIKSQGYSRFEIEDGNVIADYPEPVTFNYLGYEVSASRLRFNQATMVAEASGSVVLSSSSLGLQCNSVSLSGNDGLVTASGNVAAADSGLGLSMHCSQIILSFPAGKYDPAIEETSARIEGGICLCDQAGNTINADAATLDGATRTLTIPGAVRGEFVLQEIKSAAELQIPATQTFQLACEGLSAEISADGELAIASASQVRLFSESMQLALSEGSLSSQRAADSPGSLNWQINGSGSPVTITLKSAAQTLQASSENLSVLLTDKGVSSAELSGSAKVWLDNSLAQGEHLRIVPAETGYRAAAQGGFLLTTDISAISGMQPVDLQSQLQQRKR